MKLRLALVMVALGVTTLMAQTFRGTILGTVADKSRASISGAMVVVRNMNTGLERTTQTSADGSYSVSELPIGTYRVIISQTGFQSSITSGVAVDVAGERRVDVVLNPGKVEESVEVSAESLPQVETTSNVLGGTLTSTTIENLPVNGRDYSKLIYLNPGVAGSPDQITDSPGSFGVFSMNGNRGRSNNFLLDGTDMNDGYRNDPAINEPGVFGDPATILPIDAVAELRVLSNYEAEYGRNSGAVVNIVTKSGTNHWHGSALEYWRSSQLGARNFFNIASQPKNPFHNNQFGGALGGPIVKDKTFFFVDYEGQRETGAQSGTSCVPDPALIASEEATLTAAGTLNPVSAALIARQPWPTPNIPGAASDITGCTTSNFSTSSRFSNRIDSMIAKLDHNLNAHNLITGRYYFGDSDQSFPFAQLAAGILPSFNTVTPTRVQLVSLSYVKVISNNQLNEARLGWNRFVEGFSPQDSNFNPASIGLNTGVTSPFDFGLPKISVGGFSAIGATTSVPKKRVDSNWHFIDNYSWKSGRNDMKFGYEFRRTTITQVIEPNFRGSLTFPDLTTFLEGIPSKGNQARGSTARHTFENSHGVYIQDSFRWNRRLTVNLGMRWDYFGVIGEKNNLLFRFNPANGGSTVQVGSPGGPKGLYNPDHNNFAPRIAFAYDLTGQSKTVIRGGWGLFYDTFSQDIFQGHIPFNCTFCPGPTYGNTGPGSILLGSVSGGPIVPGQAVYTGFGLDNEFFATNPNIRTPYVQNFNLNLEQAIGKAVLQVGYVGSKGTKLFRFRDINQPSQAAITAADLACTPGPCIDSFSVPRRFANYLYVNQQESGAGSIYHSLQTSLRLGAWHGLTTQANFVWSHSIDGASDSEDFIPNAAQPNNSLAPRLDRGNSNFDVRRRFTWNFAYSIPKQEGYMARFTNGLGFDGVLSIQDGQPFQLNYFFEGDYSGSGEGVDRLDVIGPVHYGKGPSQFLDLSSFAAPCTTPTGLDIDCVPGTRHFGNMGRNSLRGPSFKEFNFSIFKNTALTERVILQIRAESFNLFNHPNFSNPSLPSFIADPGLPGPNGRYTGFFPITTTSDVGIGNPFLGGGGPRGIQLAAKITF